MSDPNVNEPNMTESDYQSAQPTSEEWTPPPFPEEPMPEEEPAPQVSEVGSLAGIFFEPSRTFESFRKKPRFISATIIMILLFVTFSTLYFQKNDYSTVIRTAIEKSPRAAQLSPEQIDQQVKMQSSPIFKMLGMYVFPPIGIIIVMFVGGLLYLAGVMMMGGKIRYLQAVGVWVYSSFAPTVIAVLLNIIVLFIKSPESYDIVSGSRLGLVNANLGVLVSSESNHVLHTLLASFDVFSFYGMFLAALGLRILGNISTGLAWTIVIVLFVIKVALGVLFASLGFA